MVADVEALQTLEKIIYDLIVRKAQGGNRQEISKALFGFITSAEPDFFQDYLEPLKLHLEKLAADYEARPHTLPLIANQVAGLVIMGRQGDSEALKKRDW